MWHRRLGHTHPTPRQLLDDELVKAARHGRGERVRLLLDHGADPDGVGTAHPVFGGHTARQVATMYGHAELLGEANDPVLRFLGACMRADEAAAERLRTPAAPPHHLVAAAADGRTDAVRLMARLGFEVHGMALHQAAFHGHLDTVRALIELGADPLRTDPSYHATPRGWAEHNQQWAVAEYLATVERSRAG
ncbi:ankyrin repeat domain-containing protein [Dactylosporangium cerinum]